MGVHPFVNPIWAEVPVGGYVSLIKTIPVLLVLLLWARLLTWVDKDAPAAHLPRVALNSGFLSGMVLAFALFFLLPNFLIALGALLLFLAAEVGTYLVLRNQKVGLGDLRHQFEAWIKSFAKEKQVKVVAGQIMLAGAKGQAAPIPASDAPDRPAYDALQDALLEPLKKNAEQIDIAPADNGVGVQYVVDLMKYKGKVLERTVGSAAIGYLKQTAGLDVEDRRKPQTGTMRFTMDGTRHDVKVQTAGNTAGEYVRLLLNPKKRHDYTLPNLGLTEAQLKMVKESIADNKGLVLVTAPKGAGLTTLIYGIIRAHDAFLTHIQTIEREPEEDLEGITQNKLPPNSTPADELKSVDWTISQEPDVILINKVEDARSAASLIKYAKSGKRVYVGMRAGTAFEALEQWRKLVGDDRQAVDALAYIIAGRVLRKLCSACKEGYAPDPNTLRRLNMDPQKISTLYRARQQPLRDQKGNPIPCEFCNDLHFKGRVGVFETVVFDDEMRDAVAAGKNPAPVFRKQRGRYLQEEALALVESGDTSVEEVIRVVKGDGGAAPAAPAGPAPGAGGRPSGRPSAPATPRTGAAPAARRAKQ